MGSTAPLDNERRCSSQGTHSYIPLHPRTPPPPLKSVLVAALQTKQEQLVLPTNTARAHVCCEKGFSRALWATEPREAQECATVATLRFVPFPLSQALPCAGCSGLRQRKPKRQSDPPGVKLRHCRPGILLSDLLPAGANGRAPTWRVVSTRAGPCRCRTV